MDTCQSIMGKKITIIIIIYDEKKPPNFKETTCSGSYENK